MRRTSFLALSALAAAAFAADSPLAPLGAEVEARLTEGGLEPKQEKALGRVAADLADDATLADFAASGAAAARDLGRAFRGDAELIGLLEDAADGIAASADAERTALGPATGTLGDAAAEKGLVRGLRAAGRFLRLAGDAPTKARLALLARACRKLETTRARTGAVPVAGDPAMPDFRFRDANEASSTYRRRVSPRDRVGRITAWYFGHSTWGYCRSQFGSLADLQEDLRRNEPEARIDIVGVNGAGFESGNSLIPDHGAIPWLQDPDDGTWTAWSVVYRDVIVLDEANRRVATFNLTDHDLTHPDEYAALRALLLAQ